MQTSMNNAQNTYDRLSYLMNFSEYTISGHIEQDDTTGQIVLHADLITSAGLEELGKEFDNTFFFSKAFGGFVF